MRWVAISFLVVLVGGLAWFFVPGLRRQVTEGWQQMNDEELRKHWEFYYDESIKNLEAKVTAAKERQVDLRVNREEAHKRLKDQETHVQRLETASKEFGSSLRAAGGSPPDGAISIKGISYDNREKALGQLRVLAGDLVKQKKRLGTMAEQHRKTSEVTDEHMAVVRQLQERVRELREQRDELKANVELAKVREDLQALSNISSSLSSDPDIQQLQKVKALIDKQLLRADVVARLNQEEAKEDQQRLSADAYLRRLEEQGQSAEIDAMVKKLLEEP